MAEGEAVSSTVVGTLPLVLADLPARVDLHGYAGSPFAWLVTVADLDVTAVAWTATPPVVLTAVDDATLEVSFPATGPTRSRWTGFADGRAVMAGTLTIDRDAVTTEYSSITIMATAGPAGAPGVTPLWWSGTQAAYDALAVKDLNTLYVITGP